MYPEKKNPKLIFCTYGSLTAGSIVGSCLFFACILWLHKPILEYGLEDFDVVQMMNLPFLSYALYISRRRVLQWAIFFALWIATSYYVAAFGFTLVVGGYFGFLLCDLFVKFGGKGLLYTLALFIPHYILTFCAVYYMGKWFGSHSSEKTIFYNNVNKMQYFVKIFAIFLLIAASVFIEIKFQKNILKYFYQHLVG